MHGNYTLPNGDQSYLRLVYKETYVKKGMKIPM